MLEVVVEVGGVVPWVGQSAGGGKSSNTIKCNTALWFLLLRNKGKHNIKSTLEPLGSASGCWQCFVKIHPDTVLHRKK